MSKSNLLEQYEHFRSGMIASINSLEIDDEQKQTFLISLQHFYLQMLTQIPAKSSSIVQAEILN